VKRGLGLLEITGFGPALVAIDALDKAADVELDHVELNDYYGVCVKLTGTVANLRMAVDTAKRTVEAMAGKCIAWVIAAPAAEAWKGIRSEVEYNPLIEQNVVFYPEKKSTEVAQAAAGKAKDRAMGQEPSFAIGLIETQGFTAVIEAIDTACKAANVEILGKEKLGGGYITIMIKGDVAAVEAAVAAGKQKVDDLGKLIAAHVIARPSDSVLRLLTGK
jgi:microcompartment protein CcmL/EutN